MGKDREEKEKKRKKKTAAPKSTGTAEVWEDDHSTASALPLALKRSHEGGYLIVLSGPQMGVLYSVAHGQSVTIGRQKDCNICLLDDGVSRRHLRITMKGPQEAIVEDLGSRNGTFVNGTQMQTSPLKSGDKIQLGYLTTLRFSFADQIEEEYQRRLLDAAIRDPVTSLYNRRYFDDRLESEFSAARRHGRDLSLLLIDIDHFKQINDRHGHLAGDEALRTIAQLMSSVVRKEDILARYGGEEFVALARETNLAGAKRLGERIRAAVETMQVGTGSVAFSLTVSVGIAVSTQIPSGVMKEFLDAADRALYLAKQQGRNRVVDLVPADTKREP